MANQIIDKALAYLGNQFAKSSISITQWSALFAWRSDGTTVDVTIPCSSLRIGSSYTINSTTWNFADTGGNNFVQVTVTQNTIQRISRDIILVKFNCPSDMTGSRYGIAVNRGTITITAN